MRAGRNGRLPLQTHATRCTRERVSDLRPRRTGREKRRRPSCTPNGTSSRSFGPPCGNIVVRKAASIRPCVETTARGTTRNRKKKMRFVRSKFREPVRSLRRHAHQLCFRLRSVYARSTARADLNRKLYYIIMYSTTVQVIIRKRSEPSSVVRSSPS